MVRFQQANVGWASSALLASHNNAFNANHAVSIHFRFPDRPDGASCPYSFTEKPCHE